MDLENRPSLWEKMKRAALAADAFVDSSLWESARRAGETWSAFSARMERLHVSGLRRVMVELSCEGLTWGAATGVLLLALALPAMRDTEAGLPKAHDLAVTFLDRTGEEIGKRGIKHDDSVAIDVFPDHLVKAALATEDRRFYQHLGIDPIGTFRALIVNTRAKGVVQGGSTITQQLAKNLFLTNERSIERKVREAFLAMWLESRLTKNEILKLYLDRAYMGGGTFGVAAASEFYFGKPVTEVSLAESAMLAGLFKAPTRFAPHINLPAARARAGVVLDNMVEAGFLTEGQVVAARRNPATPIDRGRDIAPEYYLDAAFEQIKRFSADGKLKGERVVVVRTPLDRAIQRRAEETVESILRQYGKQYGVNQAALVLMEPNGAVRALVGGRDYGASQFNRATDALRQPGSSFKPFVYAAALNSGKFKPETMVVDAPVCIGNWCPNNYTRSYAGRISLTTALAKSYNSVPVRLSIAIGDGSPKAGRARIVDVARRMGLTTALTDTPPLPIGAVEVTVLDMTAAYAAIANGGRKATPHFAIDISDSRGEILWSHAREAGSEPQVLASQVAADLNLMMHAVVEQGTGRRTRIPGLVSAGKTGTTNAYRDAWYVGYTGNYAAGVWFGNDDYQPTNRMTGGSLPGMTWREVMLAAHEGVEPKAPYGLPAAPPPADAAVALGTGATSTGGRIMVLSPASARAIQEIGSGLESGRARPRADAGPAQAPQDALARRNETVSIGGRITPQ